jgi:hypothetical protein
MKRLMIVLAAVGISSSSFAALPMDSSPSTINVPQLDGGFVLGVTGLYMQPSASNGDLDYASVNSAVSPNSQPNLKAIEPGYDFGWGVNLGYVFPGTGNDVNLIICI